MITKSSVVKYQNFIMNNESWLVKLNPIKRSPFLDSKALTADERYWQEQIIEKTCSDTIQLKNYLLVKELKDGGLSKS